MEQVTQFFAQEKDKLSSFIYRMTNNLQDTEDLIQETLLTALEKQNQFKGDAQFKTWIFSIASNKTIDHLRKEKRWSENVMDHAKSATLASPDFFQSLLQTHQSAHGAFDANEHIELCFRCIGKTLPIEQQVALILKDIYSFTVNEITQILDRTPAQVKHYVEDARASMISIFDRRCALINKEGVCNQCSELHGIFNSQHDFQQKKMTIQFAKEAANRSKEELYELRNELVKSIDPLHSEGHLFQQKHTDHICKVARQTT